MRALRRPFSHGPSLPQALPAVGDSVAMDVLGLGRVDARVERIDMVSQEGVRDLAWRVGLRLPDGSPAQGLVRGNSLMCFLDPRHRLARP